MFEVLRNIAHMRILLLNHGFHQERPLSADFGGGEGQNHSEHRHRNSRIGGQPAVGRIAMLPVAMPVLARVGHVLHVFELLTRIIHLWLLSNYSVAEKNVKSSYSQSRRAST